MAQSVNNIAATFATLQSPSQSSSSSFSTVCISPSLHRNSICLSWNPHSTLPKSKKSSLLNLYGQPGPRPLQSTSTVRSSTKWKPKPVSVPAGGKLPNVTLSFLNGNKAVQSVSLSGLCKGKRAVIVGVSAAFSPSCTRFVKEVEASRAKSVDLIACVAANDVYVMRAWGENLAVGGKVLMLSDGKAELNKALGLGSRSTRFCLSASNGVITGLAIDEEDEHSFPST